MLVHHFLFLRRSAHFAINGYDVNLCNRTANKLQPIVDRGGVITLHGAVEGAGRLNMVDAKGACVRALVRVCGTGACVQALLRVCEHWCATGCAIDLVNALVLLFAHPHPRMHARARTNTNTNTRARVHTHTNTHTYHHHLCHRHHHHHQHHH